MFAILVFPSVLIASISTPLFIAIFAISISVCYLISFFLESILILSYSTFCIFSAFTFSASILFVSIFFSNLVITFQISVEYGRHLQMQSITIVCFKNGHCCANLNNKSII